MGFAWQGLGLGFVLLGHRLSKRRTSVLLPFFAVGYSLLGFGFTRTAGDEALSMVGLGLLVSVCLATAAAVILGRHRTWSALVARLISPEARPYAYQNVHHAFLLLGAWLAAAWLFLLLSYTRLALPQQGIVLVLLAGVWIALGRRLLRLPGVVGWPVYGAGWFMWVVGLLQVFFAPTEALIALVLGLAISVEGLYPSDGPYWLPVLILQLWFAAFQIVWLLGGGGLM